MQYIAEYCNVFKIAIISCSDISIVIISYRGASGDSHPYGVVFKYIWRRLGLTCWGVVRGAQVWIRQVMVQGRKQQKAPGLQRDFEPDESSLDRQEGVSEEDWASPTPDKEDTHENNK